MPMSQAGMKSKIIAAMEASGFTMDLSSLTKDGKDWGSLLIDAIATGVYDEIVDNALVTTTSGAPDGEHTGNVT